MDPPGPGEKQAAGGNQCFDKKEGIAKRIRIPPGYLTLVFPQSYYTQHFSSMNRSRFVEHRVLNRDQQLIVATSESSGQRLVAGLHNHSFANHVPELLLRNPVFFTVVAYDQGGFFYFHSGGIVSRYATHINSIRFGAEQYKARFHASSRRILLTSAIARRPTRLLQDGGALRPLIRRRRPRRRPWRVDEPGSVSRWRDSDQLLRASESIH